MSGKELSSYLKPEGAMAETIAEHDKQVEAKHATSFDDAFDLPGLDEAEERANAKRDGGFDAGQEDEGDCDGCKI